ncbi:UNVERIFIED_CONTAM: hypothetical protein FKN15_050902 [Acipenser sinensis]
MTEHAELLAEMPAVGRMTTAERLKHAHKRRAQQLKTWAQMEKEAPHRSRGGQGGKQGCRITFPNNVTLLEAAARNDLEEVREFLKNGVSPDLYNEDGLTALHQCCIDDFEEVVQALVDAGANVNACDSELWTPLHAAATCGHMGLVETLIKHGANMLAVNADGNMPYDLCEDEVTLDYIETAMANQGQCERIDECRSSKERQMVADIRALIQAGSDLNAQDDNGTSLLHIAAANGYQRTAELLLEHKARVEVRDSDGWSPLHAASCWGQSSGPDPQDEPAQRESNGGKRELSVGNGSTSSALPMEPRGSRLDRSASYQLATEEPAEGDLSREKSHHTLADLKRQRAAAKLYKQPSTTGDNSQDLPPLESPRASTEPSTVHNTPSSTEPPLLKLRAPEEEHPPEKQRCCYLM